MRIAKAIARAGICSRREAEKLIEQGKVTLNGKVLNTPAVTVTESDTITVNGKPLKSAEPARLFAFHKPSGCITSTKDPQGRKTVFDYLPDNLPRLITVGRLDYNSEGLLLMTNDGELARKLELPENKYKRVYRVRAYGKVSQRALDRLAQGVTINGVHYEPIKASFEKPQGGNTWMIFELQEGKNREIRKICEYLGMKVNRLIRLSYGPYTLGKLPKSQIKELTL